MPDTTTTNAPVGPPICTREPPRAEIVKPAIGAAIQAGLRRKAGGNGERHRQRQGDEPDGDAGDEIGGQQSGRVALAPALDQLGQGDWRQRQAAHGADRARYQHIHILIYNYRT